MKKSLFWFAKRSRPNLKMAPIGRFALSPRKPNYPAQLSIAFGKPLAFNLIVSVILNYLRVPSLLKKFAISLGFT